MTALIDIPLGVLKRRRVHGFFDEFYSYTSGERFTSVLPDDGSAAVIDGAGGLLELVPSDETPADNDEAYVKGTHESFQFAPRKPIVLEARLQFTEAGGDDANIIVGLVADAGADSLQDDGGGPPASYTGVVFFKVDGETVWNCEHSQAANQVTTVTEKTAGGSDYQTFRIEFRPITPTAADVVFFIDGVEVAKHSGFDYSGAAAMQPILGVKNGGANAETLLCDYLFAFQAR